MIVVDCHFHLDENMLSLEKLIGAMDKAGIGKTVLMAKLCEPFYIEHNPKNERLKKLMRGLILNLSPVGKGIYKSFLDGRGNFKIMGNTVGISMVPDNSSVAGALKRYPERFLGWITVNPGQGNPQEEIEAFWGLPGMVGVKVHPFFHGYRIEQLDSVAGFCQERNCPLIIHLSSQPGCYRHLPEKFPRLKVIYAHAGIPHFRKIWEYVKTKKNVYLDLSSDYLDENIAGLTVKAVGHEKCLYGTDGPYGIERPGGAYDYSKIKGWVERMSIPDRQKEDILGGNFMQLIN